MGVLFYELTEDQYMSNKHCVIIGGSHAAVQLATSLKQNDWQGKISIISAEASLPYHSPPLSKAYLNNSVPLEKILLKPAKFYEKHNINLMLNTKVTDIDRAKKEVKLDNGDIVPYSKLAITTGAKVRKIDIPGCSLNGVYYLRTLEDVEKIKGNINAGKSAVIIGGGYIGLETASSLTKAGVHVTLLEAMPRILQRVTTEQISNFYTRIHSEEGVNIVVSASVKHFEGQEHIERVVCENGDVFNADMVIIGVGVIPETSLAEQAQLNTNNGIIVDEYARTNDHDIVAAGDCTLHVNPIYNKEIRLESVQNANDQARVAANTLCGKLEAYHALPWFWSDQYDIKLQIAGLSHGYDQVIIRGKTISGRSFAAFYFSEGKLIAVDAINCPKEFMHVKRALSLGKTIGTEHIADESMEIKDILFPAH